MEKSDLRILHLMKSLNIGGTEKSTIVYSNYLAKYFVWIGIFAPQGFFSHKNIVNNSVQLIESRKIHTINPVKIFSNFLQVSNIIKHKGISIIHYHHRIYLPVIYLIRVSFPSVRIYYTHHCHFNDIINFFLIADRFIAVSKSTQDDLLKYGKKNITIINHGLLFSNLAEKKINFPKLNLGFIGRFDKVKGIKCILRSMSVLVNQEFGGKLILRGEGRLCNYIKKFIFENKLNDRIIIKHPTSDINEMFEDIDLLIAASSSIEGFGLVIIEAASVGIPVIASNISSHSEIISDGVNGLLFKLDDIMDLSNKIIKISLDKTLYKNISMNSYESAKKRFGLNNTIYCYKNLYSDSFSN